METEREITLLWKRVNMLADHLKALDKSTDGRICDLGRNWANVSSRLTHAIEAAADYRENLEDRLDALQDLVDANADAVIDAIGKHNARLDEIEDTRPLPRLSFWQLLRGWG